MAESSTTPNIRPRVREAVEVWDSLPQSDKKYKNVAERMNITEGRAAVYVREGLVALGRGDETPRGNGTGTSSRATREVSDFEAQLEAMVEQNRAVADDLDTQVSEAAEDAANFDPEKYIEGETKRLTDAVAEAQRKLSAWTEDKDGATTKAATEQGERLRKRAESLAEANAEQIVKARTAADMAEKMLANYKESIEVPATGGDSEDSEEPTGDSDES
jgi:hypothetical protein